MPEFEELTETFTADGLKEEEARNKAYLTILPKLQKGLQIYLSRSSTMDRTNEERHNTRTGYENERRLCKR